MARHEMIGNCNRSNHSLPAAAAMFAAVLLSPLAQTAWAHGGKSHAALPWWQQWNLDPLVLANLALLSGAYTLGRRRMRGRAEPPRGVTGVQAAAFYAGIAVLVVALVSPLDVLADQLGWVHMTQHMLLMMLAAPLLLLGAPGLVLRWALPAAWRRPLLRGVQKAPLAASTTYALWHPGLVWALYAAVLWVWHYPPLYGAALRQPWLHDLQHLAFVIAALLFWRVALDPLSRRRLDPLQGCLYLFTTSLHATALGVLMTLVAEPWYREYRTTTAPWGLTPLEDQQLAGLIMWMPACAAYAVVVAGIFWHWFCRGGTGRGAVRRPIAAKPAGRSP